MDISFSRWHLAITERRSRRHFDQNRPIEPGTLVALDTLCNQFRPFPHARSRLVTESGKGIFKGIVGSYGKIKGAPTFIALIRDMNSPFVQEEVGYTGEGIILEATALGLNTCWVAGFFRPKSVASLIEIGRKHRRLSISKLINGVEIERWPEWVRDKEVEAQKIRERTM